jgi:hypothetical protein
MMLIEPSSLSLHDELDARIRRSIRHLIELNNPEMRMEFTHPDEFWHWGADYMGRWIGSMGLLSQYTGEDYGVKQVVEELIGFKTRTAVLAALPLTRMIFKNGSVWTRAGGLWIITASIPNRGFWPAPSGWVIITSETTRYGRVHVRVLLERAGRYRRPGKADR